MCQEPRRGRNGPQFQVEQKSLLSCCRCCQWLLSSKLYDTSICGQGLTKKNLSREDRRHSCDDDSSLYGFDMAVKQTVSTHVSSLSVDVININRSTESRCAANFYMGTLFVFSDS